MFHGEVDDMRGAKERIHNAVAGWPGVTSGPHRFGGVEFRLGERELGHLHGESLLDVPFPRSVRKDLVSTGMAREHHMFPDSGWVSLPLKNEQDVEKAILLLRRSYEIVSLRALRHREAAGV